MDRPIQVRKDLMERAVFAAGVHGPGKDEGGEEFVQVELEIMREFEIIHIFFDMEIFQDRLKGEITQAEDRGNVGNFADAFYCLFPVQGIHFRLEMSDRVSEALFHPGFHGAEGLIASVCCTLLFAAVKAFIDREISPSFEFCFFEVKSHKNHPFKYNATSAIIITYKNKFCKCFEQ